MRHDRVTCGEIRLTRPDAIADLLAPDYVGLAHEQLAILYLDHDFGLASTTIVRGAATVELPIRRIAREALALGARGVVIAHNHPGGDATPSRADRSATRRLAEVLRALTILLVDHVVFGREEWVSFHRLGWL